MSKSVWRVTLLAGLLASGLLASTMVPAADSERSALEAAFRRWMTAVNEQDMATQRVTMTDDVELFDASGTVAGRDAALRALREVAMRGRLVATSHELVIAKDMAWHVVGLVQTRENGDVQARGQALEIWKRVKGEWKLHRRMTAEAISAGVSLTRPATKEPVLDSRRE
jgi:ketosteroid isomerase-like protein